MSYHSTIILSLIIEGELFTIPANSIVITGDFSEGTAGYDQTGQCDIDCASLLLRSIDSLTDEEIKTIAEMNGWNNPKVSKDVYDERILQYKVDLPSICNPAMRPTYLKPLFDYLILIGTLLPFTYLNEDNKPITLTTQQIVDAGWAKYQTP